jgi:predicted RNA-binding protein (virulence factor B family)
MSHIKTTDLFIIAKTPLGYKVIVDDKFEGMIYHNEIFEEIKIGDRKKGYVKNIREDGKFDLSLQPIGDDKEAIIKEKIVSLLNKEKHLPYNYKSDAQDLKKVFGLSKKNFKKALTKLQDEGTITIDKTGIRLL